MSNYTEKKINQVFELALKLGLDKSSKYEKEIFKNSLIEIAVAAIDESTQFIDELMHQRSNVIVSLKK